MKSEEEGRTTSPQKWGWERFPLRACEMATSEAVWDTLYQCSLASKTAFLARGNISLKMGVRSTGSGQEISTPLVESQYKGGKINYPVACFSYSHSASIKDRVTLRGWWNQYWGAVILDCIQGLADGFPTGTQTTLLSTLSLKLPDHLQAQISRSFQNLDLGSWKFKLTNKVQSWVSAQLYWTCIYNL